MRRTSWSRRLLVGAAGFVGVLFAAWPVSPAAAWTTFGCQFPDNAGRDTIPYTVYAISLNYATPFNAAVAAWNNSGAGTYINLAVSNSPYDNELRVYNENYGNVSWSGQVDDYQCGLVGTWYVAPRVKINAYYDYYSSDWKRGVIVHEFGHALGLGHVSSNAVMIDNDPGRAACGCYNPQGDDVVGISSLYPSWK